MSNINFDKPTKAVESISNPIWCEVKAVLCSCTNGACPHIKLYKPVKEVKEPVVKERKPRKPRDD